MKRIEPAALLHVLTSLLAMAVALWAEPRLPIAKDVARPLGELIFLAGMALFIWAVAHLRRAFLGDVKPVTETLVTSGPYRHVRHPLYLSMLITLLGFAVSLRSSWGVVATFLLFLPAAVYRAKLEERCLAREFGEQWQHYAKRASFMIPALW